MYFPEQGFKLHKRSRLNALKWVAGAEQGRWNTQTNRLGCGHSTERVTSKTFLLGAAFWKREKKQ